MDPEDDPNNQGEDEFEEAEDQQPQHRVVPGAEAAEGEEEEEEEEVVGDEEPVAPAKHADPHAQPNQRAAGEELVVSIGGRMGLSIHCSERSRCEGSMEGSQAYRLGRTLMDVVMGLAGEK